MIKSLEYLANGRLRPGKYASRKSLKSDNSIRKALSEGKESSVVSDSFARTVQDDSLRASKKPVSDTVGELLHSPDPTKKESYPDSKLMSGETVQPIANDDNPDMRSVMLLDTSHSVDLDALAAEGDTFTASSPSAEHNVSTNSDIALSMTQIELNDNMQVSKPTGAEVDVLASPSSSAIPSNWLETACAEAVDNAVAKDETSKNSKVPDTAGDSSVSPKKKSDNSPIVNASVLTEPGIETPKSVTISNLPQYASPSNSTFANMNTPGFTRANPLGETPQIGTSLLRRESLRRNESPLRKKDLRKSSSPRKRETLQRRDTLQEREILRQVIADKSTNPPLEDVERQTMESNLAHANVGSSSPVQVTGDDVRRALSPIPGEREPSKSTAKDTESPCRPVDEISLGKDLQRAKEAIEVFENPLKIGEVEGDVVLATDDMQAQEAIDDTNERIARAELDEAAKASDVDKEAKDLPSKNTRSGARFSDDTSMLKDFLNRAQARKAAKTPDLSASLPVPQISPRRSPRKALGSHGGNALSPQKLGDITDRPGTPPGKLKVDIYDSDDAEEIAIEPTSCRRSSRTRLPAPSKAAPGAPSFIPVRRADGTDPVVLQKSQAQELAIVTRANTRRNKGQSKPPLLALKELPVEATEVASNAKQRAENAKSVGWAERIASYQGVKEAAEASEEKRPKVRKLKAPGAGTPAPKRTTATVGTSNGTPAPKRRGGKSGG